MRYFYKGNNCDYDVIIQEFKQPQPTHWLSQSISNHFYLPLSFMPDLKEQTLSVLYFKPYQSEYDPNDLKINHYSKGSIFVETFFLDVTCVNNVTQVSYKGQTKPWSTVD